jgi:hypothetical protein
MLSNKAIDDLTDFDLLNWILDQDFIWRQELDKIANVRTLQGLVDFVRNNSQKIKQIENEKARTYRKA